MLNFKIFLQSKELLKYNYMIDYTNRKNHI